MTNLAGSIALDLVSRGDPHQIMGRLVRFAAENIGVDRCTLTSLDQNVLRVEASYERGGPPDFVGREYPLTWLSRQPLLYQAVNTGAIVLGGSLGAGGTDPALAPSLLAMQHTAIVPLSVGESVGAVLILSRMSDRPFVAHELEGLQQVGMLAVLALRNARLVEQMDSFQRRGLDSLTQMSRHVASTMEPAAFFEKMSETVAGLVTAERAAFWQLTGSELTAMHELRAPITLVSGYLSMLEEGTLGELPEAAAKAVPLMTARLKHMSELVDRMLTTSRMEIRARGHNARDISVDALARAVAASLSTRPDGSTRQISVDSARRVRLRADPEQVETILRNLVSNAVKYSPDGDNITITVREEPTWVMVDVTDHGYGIAEEDIPKLFQLLLVDDDVDVATMYAMQLTAFGFRVTTAHSGVEAVDRASTEAPNLIYLDLGLSEMHGFEVLEQLRAEPSTAGIPVVILTNYSEPELIRRGRELGANDYLIKAHTPPAVLAAATRKWVT